MGRRRYSRYDNYGWGRYVPVAERRANARNEVRKLQKAGQIISPVEVSGRTIARTFWGKAWCDNLERYSDYANRLPRGRTYVRNGSVVDLQIRAGQVTALVAGSSLYTVHIAIAPLPASRWASIRSDSAGAIDSLVELLQGRLSKGVMERISRRRTGLFPSPAEIELSCSCPDWATMCKHVAATLYGVGARLDDQPELLFLLRDVDASELIAEASRGVPLAGEATSDKLLDTDDLSGLFGLDMEGEPPAQEPPAQEPPAQEPDPDMAQAIAAVRARVITLRQEDTDRSRDVLAHLEEWLAVHGG